MPRLINFTIDIIDYMPRLYLLGVILNINAKINHVRHFIQTPSLIKGWNLLIYLVHSEIIRYNQPYLIISRTVRYQSSVKNIMNTLGALYFISIKLFLILISKLVPLTSTL